MRPIIQCHLVNGPFGDPVVYADIMFERYAVLFDIGTIGSLPPRKLLRIGKVLVSHAHMDHFAGFDHLLRLVLGRGKHLSLYGPPEFIERVEHRLLAYTWNVIERYPAELTLDVCEIHGDGFLRHARFRSSRAFRRENLPRSPMRGDLLESAGPLTIRCAVLDHGTPSIGYAIEEQPHINVWKTRLDARGLAVGPWLRDLKRAIREDQSDAAPLQALRRTGTGTEPVTLPLGDVRGVVEMVPGQKIAYVVDARSHERNAEAIEHLASEADLFFVECAFLQADADHAAYKNHLTAWQAGWLSRRARVKQLVPCHFSTRYMDRPSALSAEAEAAFRGASPEGAEGSPSQTSRKLS